MEKPDIFFLSFDETNRELNWSLLNRRFPRARRLHGVKGLVLAHQMCAQLSQTAFFFVVNGDNEICESFHFKLPEIHLKNQVYCWRSLNPVNHLIYGFGGVKLFPKTAFQNLLCGAADIATSLKVSYRVVREVASVTCFNASPLEAFRGAFRECVKLSSRCIYNQNDEESKQRLYIWCHKGEDQPFGSYVLGGARFGRSYGLKYKNNQGQLKKINDFQWISDYFFQNKDRFSGRF